MISEIECKNCGNVVDVDDADIQKRLNEILAIIQFGTHKKVVSLSMLTILDDCVECCEIPDYYEIY